mgnify:FL=1
MRLFNVNPRTFIAIGHDIVVAALVWAFTFSLRWNFELDHATQIILFQTLPVALAVQVGCFVYFGLYQGIWRYASIHDMRLIALSVGVSGIIIPILLLLLRNGLGVPRSIYFLDPLLLILFMCTGRLLYRWWKEKAMGTKGVEPQPVILLGAGNTALSLIDDLNRNPYWYVIGVLDDNPNKVGRQLGGVRILGNWEQLEQIARDSNCKHAVLAVGATNHATRRRVFEMCERAHIKLLVIPDVQELMSGQVKVSQIRYVDVDDLLGRDPVSLDTGGLRQMLEGKSVLVTGGGGSIGSELCRQIARFKPGELIIFELSEFALYRITEDLKRTFPQQKVVPVVGDIKDRARLEEIFEHHRPAIVYHAAAYKHVPILEENNAWQAVRNNALGTRMLADVAARFDIERFVYISSDKAVNPTNVMGATKRLAEMILQYQHSMATLPMVLVRFGNVLGSSGSVIPKFREQIANGGPITVTHPDITRYFMSIPEATQLVLQAGLMGRGGETFVLDMGQPIRIVDLARTMVRLSGYTEAEIPIAFTGLRPGEKLFEELLADNEKTLPTPHPKLRVSRPIDPPGTSWDISVRRWLESNGSVGDAEVRQMLGLWVPEYRPAPLHNPTPDDSSEPAGDTAPAATDAPGASIPPARTPIPAGITAASLTAGKSDRQPVIIPGAALPAAMPASAAAAADAAAETGAAMATAAGLPVTPKTAPVTARQAAGAPGVQPAPAQPFQPSRPAPRVQPALASTTAGFRPAAPFGPLPGTSGTPADIPAIAQATGAIHLPASAPETMTVSTPADFLAEMPERDLSNAPTSHMAGGAPAKSMTSAASTAAQAGSMAGNASIAPPGNTTSPASTGNTASSTTGITPAGSMASNTTDTSPASPTAGSQPAKPPARPALSPAAASFTMAAALLAESRQDDEVQSQEELAALLPDNDNLLARLKRLAQVATHGTEHDEESATRTPAGTQAPAPSAAPTTETAAPSEITAGEPGKTASSNDTTATAEISSALTDATAAASDASTGADPCAEIPCADDPAEEAAPCTEDGSDDHEDCSGTSEDCTGSEDGASDEGCNDSTTTAARPAPRGKASRGRRGRKRRH